MNAEIFAALYRRLAEAEAIILDALVKGGKDREADERMRGQLYGLGKAKDIVADVQERVRKANAAED